MGMPISCYWSLVSLVRHGERCGGWIGRLRKQFSKFAFVIHDPTVHVEFDDVLNRLLDRLDYATGRRLLFFALVRPESANIEGLRDRPYFTVFEDMSPQVRHLASPGAIPISPNPSASAWAFSQALGIPFDSLPCIVTTDDLLSPEIEVIHSGPSTLYDQLSELGFQAERSSRMLADEGDQRISPREDTVRLTRSLAATLALVLGGIQATVEGRGEGGEEYLAAFKELLSDLLHDLKQARRGLNADDESLEQVEHLALTVAGVLQSLAEPSPSERGRLEEPLGSDLFDHETRIVLQTGLQCLRAIDGPRLLGGRLSLLDYSPSLLYFAKAFENEMNLSVVHWVRQRLGISLPKNFNKVQRGASAKYSSERVNPPIDFNRGHGGAWKPPSLGQAELVFSECVGCSDATRGRSSSSGQLELAFRDRPGDSVPGPFDPDTCARLMESWQAIRSLRNQAAHDAIVARDECQAVMTELERMIKSGVFQATTNLRRTLQSDSPKQ